MIKKFKEPWGTKELVVSHGRGRRRMPHSFDLQLGRSTREAMQHLEGEGKVKQDLEALGRQGEPQGVKELWRLHIMLQTWRAWSAHGRRQF